jgi:16S rRNA C1402 N4-methylase RsmH
MADEVIKALPPVAHNILDGTVGHAGHTIALYDHLCQQDVNNVYILGIDKDVDMLQTAQTRIPSTHNIQLHHAAYDDRSTI